MSSHSQLDSDPFTELQQLFAVSDRYWGTPVVLAFVWNERTAHVVLIDTFIGNNYVDTSL